MNIATTALQIMFGATPKGAHDRILLKEYLDEQWQQSITWVDPFKGSDLCVSLSINQNILDSFSSKSYGKKVENDNISFLKFDQISIPAIFSEGHASSVTSEFHFDRFRVQFFIENSDYCLMVSLGRIPLFAYSFTQNVAVFLSAYREKSFNILRSIIVKMVENNFLSDDLFSAPSQKDRRALVIADERPTHFLRQTMGFLDLYIDTHIVPFLRLGGELFVVRDRCFVDPTDIYPQLNCGTIVYLNDAVAALRNVPGLRLMRRVYRGETQSLTWANKILVGAQVNDSILKVLIAVDAEKSRFLNQSACLSQVISYLHRKAVDSGRKLSISWDGWTVTPFGLGSLDKQMISRVEDTISSIEIDPTITSELLFDLPVKEKINKISSCNIAITPHGTAALIPSRIVKIPTITYHVAESMLIKDDVDVDTYYPVEGHYIEEASGFENFPPHRRKFSVDPAGIISSIAKLPAY